MVNNQNHCQCSPQEVFKQRKTIVMNKPSLLFFCHAYTELQIWVYCKILLKEIHGWFRAPIIHNVCTSSLNICIHTYRNTYIKVSCFKGLENQTLNPRKLLSFCCHYCVSFLSSHMHQSCLFMHVWLLTPSCSKDNLQYCW